MRHGGARLLLSRDMSQGNCGGEGREGGRGGAAGAGEDDGGNDAQPFGNTALHYAVYRGEWATAKVLLDYCSVDDRKALVQATNSRGWTALDIAERALDAPPPPELLAALRP